MLTLFTATALYVFAKSWQQQVVVSGKYLIVPIGSYTMALMEVTIILGLVQAGTVWAFLATGTGGWIGCWLGIYFFRRYVK